ncbi:hypothetical protein BD289DRAFT_344776, partial [Coniella lustricola]
MRPAKQQLSCSRLLRSALNIEHSNSAASQLPLFLCPAGARASSILSQNSTARGAGFHAQRRSLLPLAQRCRLHTEAEQATEATEARRDDAPRPVPTRKLPVQCHGCGALSQTAVSNEPGFYDVNRKAVKTYLGLLKEEPRGRRRQDDIVQASLQSLGPAKLRELGIDPDSIRPSKTAQQQTQQDSDAAASAAAAQQVPLCDRCHNLVYNHTGEPIFHPTIEAIRDTIDESPHKYNHVYHVLDAADFPMSLLPKVHQLLELMPLRTKNRRQRGPRFFGGKRTEMSFIITRSDLLAPKKEAVDRLMPYLTEVLREALPRDSRHVRLGNVRCVSAKRSWWTQELKEDIWKRGGAGWMVGKVNVGKSQLFEAVYPKGRMDWKRPRHEISVAVQPRTPPPPPLQSPDSIHSVLPDIDNIYEDSLLPPAQPETNYPQMPVVSALPGTTASPIRVPFGRGKGELIDLPGLERSELDAFVREEHRPSLIMKARMTPEQQVLKPGQSLLIGGFIRITPRTPDLIFLAYAFTPIEPHMTATDKAIDIQNQESEVKVTNIGIPGIAKTIKHAGSFKVRYDVTKRRAGPITNKHAAGIKVDRLPYRVLSLDLLIEGCGWVEITVQVRTRDLFKPTPATSSINVGGVEILQSLDLSDPENGEGLQATDEERNRPLESDNQEPNWPVVDVFSPEGRFIGSRRPMNAWMFNKIRKTAQTSKQRPRKSMTGAKKRDKQDKR